MIGALAGAALGAVFVLAGASKLVAGPAWRGQAAGLGVPASVAEVVPWVELAVGALLIVQVGKPWTPVAALVLLVGFTAVIVRALAAGRRPVCACFGSWSAKPVGAGHLVRNAVLGVLAVVALI